MLHTEAGPISSMERAPANEGGDRGSNPRPDRSRLPPGLLPFPSYIDVAKDVRGYPTLAPAPQNASPSNVVRASWVSFQVFPKSLSGSSG